MPIRSQSTEFFYSVFTHSSVGMALVAPDGRWLEVNEALCQILGYSRDALLATSFQDVTHPDDLAADLALLDQLIAGALPYYRLEKRYLHADGHIVWGMLTVTASRDADGQASWLVSQLIDITRQKQAIEERETFFALWPDLLAIAGTDGRLRHVNQAWTDTLGWSAEALTSRPFIDFVHPDDVASTLAEAEHVYRSGITNGFRNRYRHADGSYCWLEWRTRFVRGTQLYCAVREVTREIEHVQRIQGQEQKIRLLIDNANDAFLGTDERGCITEWNKQAETMFGWTAQEAIGQCVAMLLLPPHARQALLDEIGRLAAGVDAVHPGGRIELPVLRKDGSEMLAEMTAGVIRFDGEVHFHAFLRDVSAQRRMSQQLHFRATHDSLTGLPNRFEFMARLEAAIDAAARQPPHALVLLFIDLDGFKAVNDLHGHKAGDAVLIAFGDRLQAAVRRTDQVARLAGDEFVVLLDHLVHAENDALAVAGKILAAAASPYPALGDDTVLGASIGLALYEPGDSADMLLTRADAAMYLAKRAGKNRIGCRRDGREAVLAPRD